MTQRGLRLLTCLGTAVLVILCARAIAYAVTPGTAARVLEHRGGGPALPWLALTALSIGAALAVAICWLAALGVRERALLERRPLPRFRQGRAIVIAVGLFIASSVGGGLFEAYVHWRAGLGWHGIHCIAGPVHQNLLPIEGALSTVAAAVLAAAEHVVAWMRRTFALLRSLPMRLSACAFVSVLRERELPRFEPRFTAGGPRAPPTFS
jgi:hypothetical protein